MDRELAKDIFRFFSESFFLGYIGFDNLAVEKLFDENKNQVLKSDTNNKVNFFKMMGGLDNIFSPKKFIFLVFEIYQKIKSNIN